jgi:hypothetical protein
MILTAPDQPGRHNYSMGDEFAALTIENSHINAGDGTYDCIHYCLKFKGVKDEKQSLFPAQTVTFYEIAGFGSFDVQLGSPTNPRRSTRYLC